MAMRPRTTGITPIRPRPSLRPEYEDFRPKSEWKQKEGSDILLVYLPGFRIEQISVTVESPSMIRARGERPLGNNYRRSRFNQEFRIPENCNVSGITAKFEGEVLEIIMPKKIVSQLAPTEPPPKTATQQEAQTPQKGVVGEPKSDQKPQEGIPPKAVVSSSTTSIEKQGDEKPTRSPGPLKDAMEPKSQEIQEDIPPKPVSSSTTSIEKQRDEKPAKSPSPIKDAMEPKSQMGREDTPPKTTSTIGGGEKQTDTKSTVNPPSPQKAAVSSEPKPQKSEDKTPMISTATSAAAPANIQTDDERVPSASAENVAQRKTLEKEKESSEKSKESTPSKEPVERIVKEAKEKGGDHREKAKEHSDVAKAKEAKNAAAAAGGGFNFEKYKKAVEGLPMKMREERQSLVNMGAAIAVIVALGAYISYFGSSGKAKN